MSRRPFKRGNPDLRRQVQMPGPEIEILETNLRNLLKPEDFLPIRLGHQIPEKLRRDRLLTLPVMMAVVLGLIYRRIAGLAEASRVLWDEGLLWVEPMQVSRQALSKRLMNLPVRHFAAIFEQVIKHIQTQPNPPSSLVGWVDLKQQFGTIWIADGSTLEALRRKLKILSGTGTLLAGRMMVIVELLTHRPAAIWYTEQSTANDKQWLTQLVESLPLGGLLIFDLGFFKFQWFDDFTNAKKYFLTRQREKTAYTVQNLLSASTHYRDEIILMGKNRSYPCHHPLRMVSVLWGTNWYYYLTNVLDPSQISAQQVCDLYRRRWRIEDAFALTKRLLGLSYFWVGNSNGVQIQIYATWIFYALLNDLCADVAIALNQPLERISLEMVFRSLYHFNHFSQRTKSLDVISFLTDNFNRLGILKAERPRYRQRDLLSAAIWGIQPLS